MVVLNFGSMNNDFVYTVDHFVQPGETILATKVDRFLGGKGLNQSIAAARAGADVYHACLAGEGGMGLVGCLEAAGVRTHLISPTDRLQGQAIIQVNAQGDNCIIVYGGSNQCLSKEYVLSVIKQFSSDTLVMLQNEVNDVAFILKQVKQKGMKVLLNPSPVSAEILAVDYGLVDYLIVNEVEACALFGTADPAALPALAAAKNPAMGLVLTTGSKGAAYLHGGQVARHGIYDVPVVDTTGAGDTFTGYFVAGLTAGWPVETILRRASVASSLCVSRKGASASIPALEEVLQAENTLKPL